jgi:hypothetical protein
VMGFSGFVEEPGNAVRARHCTRRYRSRLKA